MNCGNVPANLVDRMALSMPARIRAISRSPVANTSSGFISVVVERRTANAYQARPSGRLAAPSCERA